MSTLSKMAPKLNEEILLEILKELKSPLHSVNGCSGALTKFMLSGREPFYAALYYFSKADRINFWDFGFDICVKKATHCFGYDWKFLDVLLKVALPSVNHLCIYECPTNDIGNEIMDKVVLENDLKHLTLGTDLPKRYMSFFLNGCKFETVRSENLYANNTSIFEMLLIPSECHHIGIREFEDFVNPLSRRALPFKYLNVKKLVFDGSYVANANSNDQQLFMDLFYYSLVNLECIEIECNSFCSLSAVFNAFFCELEHKWTNEKFKGNILFVIVERSKNGSKWQSIIDGRCCEEEEELSDSDSVKVSSNEEEENDVDDISVTTANEFVDVADFEEDVEDDDNASVTTANEITDMDYKNFALAADV